MPIYIPDNLPKIGYSSSEADLQHQARLIADILLQCPEEWSGFIHTASIKQSHSIANRLSEIDPSLKARVWVPERMSSLDKIEAWKTRKMLRPNTIAVSWDFWTGLDAGDEEINIVAKAPFGTLDTLGKARMDIDTQFYLWETACKIEQAAGRNRRGEPEHYEVPSEPTRRICAIVDANVYRVYNQFSSFFKQRIQAVKGQPVIIRR
jgi:Rad3-related DNA helicase